MPLDDAADSILPLRLNLLVIVFGVDYLESKEKRFFLFIKFVFALLRGFGAAEEN